MTAPLRHAPLPLPLPAAAERLPMPDQNLSAPFRDPQAPGFRTGPATRLWRLLVIGLPLAVTAALGWVSLGWFALDGQLTLAEGTLVGVSVFAFYWVLLSVVTATLGLFWRASPPDRPDRGLDIAILLPMYGEPARATLAPAVNLLARLNGASRHRFALHVLSDTRDPAAVATEEAELRSLRLGNPGLAIHYRRRAQNTDYKSGNIRDWVETHGVAFEAMLILDADSLMGAETVIRMADRMAAAPHIGLVQTAPRVLPGHTLWQRMQSFASEVYGTNLARGFAMWTGPVGNFLGHNALVRTRAFAACAGLPHLPGRAPRGGVILSHDFVEAALLVRAGWAVQMLPEAEDSHEGTPETLVGYLRRDRRWCQGNMQHIRLLTMPGLHPLSRFHLLQGAMAYLASVWWLVLLVLWTLPGQGGVVPGFFGNNPAMPVWPALPPLTQGAIAGFVGLMLIAPKLLGIAAYLRDTGITRRQLPSVLATGLTELLLSILMAPMLMVHQVRAVLRTALGFDGGWVPHEADRPGLAVLARFHATETVLGAALIGLAVAGHLSPWLLPVAVSLCLSIPLAALVQMPVVSLARRRLAWRAA